MNPFLEVLSGGNLQSDGRADDAADTVLRNAELILPLASCLYLADDLIRGRAAHALERISRTRPELVRRMLPKLVALAVRDTVPMVRWHIAMILGNIPRSKIQADRAVLALLTMLKDESVFVKSWALTSLAVLGRKYPRTRPGILRAVRPLARDASISVRRKASKVVRILQRDAEPIPPGWIKSAAA